MVKGGLLRSPWLDQILMSIKGRYSVVNLHKKMTIYSPNLSMIMCIQNLVTFFQFVLKILSKKTNSDMNQGP